MPFTTFRTAGDEAAASNSRSLVEELRPLFARKTVSTPYTSNATPAVDAELILALAANNTYAWELHALANSAANAAGDIQYLLSFPTGVLSVDIHAMGPHNSMASGSQSDVETFAVIGDTTSPTTAIPFGTSTVNTGAIIYGTIVTGATAGNLQVLAAQFASNVNTTNFLAGSWLMARLVA
jgi:hypothetical protein